jgi:uncharacterized protein (DUF2384 family)
MNTSSLAIIAWVVVVLGGGCAWLLTIARSAAPERATQRRGRLEEVIDHAAHVLGDREAALAWLRRPNRVLRGYSPLSVLLEDHGEDAVMSALERIVAEGRR